MLLEVKKCRKTVNVMLLFSISFFVPISILSLREKGLSIGRAKHISLNRSQTFKISGSCKHKMN